MSSSENRHFDVCVVCAMADETIAFMDVISEQCKVQFQSDSSKSSPTYRYTTIQNNKGEPLTIHVSWPPDYGLLEMAVHFNPVLEEFKPRFAAMTGICAGDKRKVALGDLIVANHAFIADSGKFKRDDDGQLVHEYDTYTSHSARDVMQFVHLFNSWEKEVAQLKRPISKHQQRDWLLNKLLDAHTPRVEDILLNRPEELEKQAPNWRKIVQELQEGPEPFLTREMALRDKAMVTNLHYLYKFPFKDPEQARCYIGPIASSNAVRADDPFKDVQVPVRRTIAVDMEGAAFYKAVENFPGIRSLLVKGVSDYADNDKDDTYRRYACLASATYILSFIKEFVVLDRRPGMQVASQTNRKENIIPASSTTDLQQEAASRYPIVPSPSPNGKGAINIFFCYSLTDEALKTDLENQLAVLRRLGQVVLWDNYHIPGGIDRQKELESFLNQAQIILLLISQDFMADEYYDNMMKQAYDLYKTEQVRIIPILIRHVSNWRNIPFGDIRLGRLQPLPKNEVPIGSRHNRDEALSEVAEGIREVVDHLLGHP